MIGHAQYGELQYGNRSKTWISSGDKTSSNCTPATSSLFSSGDDIVTTTDYGLSITATSDISDAIDLAQAVGENYTTIATNDIGNATDFSLSSSLLLSSIQAIDVPLAVDGLFTDYNYLPFNSDELATSIQKAIGSEQYGNFQWGAISVGLPTGKGFPAEYFFTPTRTSDIGDATVKSPSLELKWSIPQTIDTGQATEIPTSISWNWGINTGLGLIVEVANSIKSDIFTESVIAGIYSTATDLVNSTQGEYNRLNADETGIGIDNVQIYNWDYTSVIQGEVGNTTLTGSPVGYALSVVTSSALSVSRDAGSVIVYSLTPTSSGIIGNATDKVSLANYFLDSEITDENITVILVGTSIGENYNPQIVSDIGSATDLASTLSLDLSSVGTIDIGNTIDGVSSTELTLVPVATIDEGWVLGEGQPTNYDLSTITSNITSSGIDDVSSAGMIYNPILVISEGYKIKTIIITHDFNSEIIHTEQ